MDFMKREYEEINIKVILCDEDVHHIKDDLVCLQQLGELIMSKISEFADKQKVFNDKMDVAIQGLQGDIKSLNDEIIRLQNSPGVITPEDQASLDLLESRGKDASDKLDALDALTPPVPPVNE